MTAQLSREDVTRLASDPSAAARADMAAKVAGQFSAKSLSPEERKIAEDIFRSLIQDAEVRVREALAESLKNATNISRDIALSMANDVESVALPILECCQVLSDEDLIEIVQGASAGKQEAIAQRAAVSADVAEALIDTGNDKAVSKLVENDGAELDDKALGRVVEEYSQSEAVAGSLAQRPNLPPAVSDQLMGVVTQHLQSYLVARHRLPVDMVRGLVSQARQRATMDMLSDSYSTEEELDALIDQLHASGRLTPEVMLDALSKGDLMFFERAMAKRADITVANARQLIHDQGPLGLQAILNAADC